MKKILSLILALALSLSLAVPALAVEEDQGSRLPGSSTTWASSGAPTPMTRGFPSSLWTRPPPVPRA